MNQDHDEYVSSYVIVTKEWWLVTPHSYSKVKDIQFDCIWWLFAKYMFHIVSDGVPTLVHVADIIL